ncbi:hypothetical protein IWW38_001521 [Coemansia aciculifera]|uniref:Uncharacterized protein n=1 Tax=Coemansia aciculifera TaxID=417176 RepID=A0ACC1M6Y6_9FUNG|nr:hypothetical protein IWW38_001521 [Coemansia aciculifera]
MESHHRRPHRQGIQDISQSSLEHLLLEHLKDATPAVLRGNARRFSDRPFSSPAPATSLQVATERCLSQLPGPAMLAAPTPAHNSDVPADLVQTNDGSFHGDVSSHWLLHRARRRSRPATAHAAHVVPAPNQAPLVGGVFEPAPAASAEDKRKHVLCELMATEEAYVRDLKVLVAVFAVPLCQYAGSRALQMELILHPLQMLFAFQHRFLRLLRRATHVVAVAQLFASEAAGFEAYIGYCSQYHWLCGTLDLLEADPEWSGFLGEVHTQINVHCGERRLGLRDFLIKPVQRICKYPLFLKDLVKHTSQAAEAAAHAELSSALELIRSVCEAIDQEQQRNDSLRLRQAVLANYSDNMELPLNLVSKLGNIVLSGPLGVVSYSNKGAKASHTLGCVLFRRFFIVLKPKRSAMLLPQFWFPLHTMQLVDDGVPCVWRLAHIGSGQCMLFEARSDEEKCMWTERLNVAISASMARMVARRAKSTPTRRSTHMPASLPEAAIHSNYANATKSAGSSPFPAPPANIVSSVIAADKNSDTGNSPTATVASPDQATPLANHGHRPFWQYGSAPASKSRQADKRFEAMTSPELLRLNALAKLKRGSLSRTASQKNKHLFSPPPFRLPQTKAAPVAVTTVVAAATNRESHTSAGSNPSPTTTVEADWVLGLGSDHEGSTTSSEGSTFHEAARSRSPRRQSLCHREPSHSRNGSNHSRAPTDTNANNTPTLSGRLLRLLGNLSIRKHRPSGRPTYLSTGDLSGLKAARSSTTVM